MRDDGQWLFRLTFDREITLDELRAYFRTTRQRSEVPVFMRTMYDPAKSHVVYVGGTNREAAANEREALIRYFGGTVAINEKPTIDPTTLSALALPSCPFCDGTSLKVQADPTAWLPPNCFAVLCACGAAGPNKETAEAAIGAWSFRPREEGEPGR